MSMALVLAARSDGLGSAPRLPTAMDFIHRAGPITCFDRLSMRVLGALLATLTLILSLSKGEAGNARADAAG